jgi:hypothetical protein
LGGKIRRGTYGQGVEVMIWRKLEIIVVFIAMGCFAFCEYERADFIMLFLIYNRLIKDVK